ncbi:uncharacterized protein FMAN_16260 [Fusarium mangiferae]|uniref:Integral membrane protein n=1 Tax=Fusarium mangiferae TaxID=192010 RepID=A0A1L7UCN6_FUSMA|nr:uncharacterized protein FMAN_16260 [Fusarium mangiferae]CVL08484.1 uncharacterized protein FMAN_16260 [Fusarium mangiferae]
MLTSFEKRGRLYPPTTAGLGGVPSNQIDTPICAVFIVLYICFAATNMTIFQKNRRRNYKFILSGVLFGFCMARVTTLVLRIAWANRQHNVRLAVAANILVNAGILLIYIINVILSQRVLRAKQPLIGWHPILRVGTKISYSLIPGVLVMVITSTVVQLYSESPDIRSSCRDVQLAAVTYLLFFTCIPILHVAGAISLPRRNDGETFGEGSMRAKVLIVTLSSCMCITIAGFKAGAYWAHPRLLSNPAWYHSKSCFYVFNFMLEVIILCLLTFSRIDKRFYIPNGSTKHGDYSCTKLETSDTSV